MKIEPLQKPNILQVVSPGLRSGLWVRFRKVPSGLGLAENSFFVLGKYCGLNRRCQRWQNAREQPLNPPLSMPTEVSILTPFVDYRCRRRAVARLTAKSVHFTLIGRIPGVLAWGWYCGAKECRSRRKTGNHHGSGQSAT